MTVLYILYIMLQLIFNTTGIFVINQIKAQNLVL